MKNAPLFALLSIAIVSQAAGAEPAWRVVPKYDYIFVDESSIHRQRPPPPARDDHHLRPWDTTADIKIDGQTYPDQHFWCVPRDRIKFGSFGANWAFTVWPPQREPQEGRFPKGAMDAVEHLVCVDLELGYSAAQTETISQGRR